MCFPAISIKYFLTSHFSESTWVFSHSQAAILDSALPPPRAVSSHSEVASHEGALVEQSLDLFCSTHWILGCVCIIYLQK